jgi:hypothetical protein
MKFELQPYEGAGPLRFRMTREEVHGLLGAPNRSWSTRCGNIAESWPEIVIRYEADASASLRSNSRAPPELNTKASTCLKTQRHFAGSSRWTVLLYKEQAQLFC